MNFNIVKTIISISISGLIAYGLYSFHSEKNREVLAIGSFISFAITLLFSLAITFKFPRTTTLIRTVSFIFFFLAFVSNLIFYFISFPVEIVRVYLVKPESQRATKHTTNCVGKFFLKE